MLDRTVPLNTDVGVSSRWQTAQQRARLASSAGPTAWAVLAGYLSLLAFLVVPNDHHFPAIIVSASVFALMQILFPRCRLVVKTIICPLNWALLIFFLQLIVLPLMITFLGQSAGTLPFLPSIFATNISLLLIALGYVSFCVAYQLFAADPASTPSKESIVASRWTPPIGVILLYIALGLVGLILNFRSISNILHYFAPSNESIDVISSTTLQSAAPNFLKPFIGFAFIVIWCKWIDRYGPTSTRMSRLVITGGLGLLALVVYATFNFNRGNFAVPLVAMAAVYWSRLRRIPIKVIVGLGLVALILLVLSGVFSGKTSVASSATNNQTVSRFVHAPQFSFSDQVQVYGQAPQFVGYLLEQTDYARKPYWGSTLISSLLFPLPILGKPFRSGSGVVIYNDLIYGPVGVFDQNLPIQGELFINFHIIGVILGFFLLGYVTSRLQRAFSRATTALDVYICVYTAVWLLFLVLGSLSAVSQIFIYFFWPIYGYLILKFHLLRRSRRFAR